MKPAIERQHVTEGWKINFLEMQMNTHFIDGMSRIFGVPTPHRIRTENGWEQDEKALQSDWEHVGKYIDFAPVIHAKRERKHDR